ncbi:hypothetical protein [Blastomonas sp.]|uniref:hypothetical protein n=1 Tax=Blastomonas sp. TaxID=1909299 RepID=UPI003594271C
MPTDLLDRFAAAQTALIAALDCGDTDGMIAHSRDLGAITDALRGQGTLRPDASTRAQLADLLTANTSAAQRLRVRRDHTDQRLAAVRGDEAQTTYRAPNARAVSRS